LDWPNLMKSGIDFGVVPMPGVNGKLGKAFVGVQVAYINRSSPNRDLAREFLEKYAFTKESLCALDHVKPIGIPAMISLYDELSRNNPLLGEMKRCADEGQVMPNICRWAGSGRRWPLPLTLPTAAAAVRQPLWKKLDAICSKGFRTGGHRR
jgi:maltose/maltodextrin transport system substrate-binding protein